jgi:hypothetical protein
MNERIRELAEQAEKYALDNVGKGHYGIEDLIYQFQFVDTKIEKFAELIVEECMACSTWVGKMNTNSSEPIQTAHAINQRIKQQFGVEE